MLKIKQRKSKKTLMPVEMGRSHLSPLVTNNPDI